MVHITAAFTAFVTISYSNSKYVEQMTRGLKTYNTTRESQGPISEL